MSGTMKTSVIQRIAAGGKSFDLFMSLDETVRIAGLYYAKNSVD